ncbi:hypothetical protein F0L74_27175 [Chitinophaga agrisoli]|uniref:Endonuclease/exonuclease/phosphatase family protein n=1 Tax=Chitinophaga agrisoli TaxID=2607653 RepID=A0A5B2VLC7_9BACT|nr:hypothetical protein [Chitinophaga agrisoli]KAA2239871.1 hypothetical protein F0L74_27175 [Chitinophaga agrisoli]
MTDPKEKQSLQPGRLAVAGEPGPRAAALPAVTPLSSMVAQLARGRPKGKPAAISKEAEEEETPVPAGKKEDWELENNGMLEVDWGKFLGHKFPEVEKKEENGRRKKKRKGKEKQVEEETEEEKADPDFLFEETKAQREKREAVNKERNQPWFSAMTSNIAKIGTRTSRAAKKQKIDTIGTVMDIMHPTLTTFQEVTNPQLFLSGEPGTRRSPAVTGLRKFKPGQTEEEEEEPSLGSELKMMDGPAFRSGGYRESYPLAYDTARIHEVPKLEYYDRGKKRFREYDEDKGPLIFGKEADGISGKSKKKAQTARQVTRWRIPLSNSPHTLRPPVKNYQNSERDAEYAEAHANLTHRFKEKNYKKDYTQLTFHNIHTAPSISSISEQMKEHMRLANESQEKGEVVVLGGDAYMQKSAKTVWKETKQSPDWDLVHSQQNTNYPGKGDGQVADILIGGAHTMTPEGPGAALAPPSDKFFTMEDYMGIPATKEELSTWKDKGTDHTPFYGSFRIKQPPPEKKIRKKRAAKNKARRRPPAGRRRRYSRR